MSKDIEVQKRCICLRNNNEIWISEDTYQKIKVAKENANGSILLTISELDREINTADIVEICTASQMADKRRIDAGERLCEYNNWHKKRERCDCYKMKMIKIKEQDRIKQEIEDNRPPTDKERKQRKKKADETRKWLENRGVIPKKDESN